MANIRHSLGPSSVSDKERTSKKEVGGTVKVGGFNIPIGLYNEVKYVAGQEGLRVSKTIHLLLRYGLGVWRERRRKEGKEA